MKHLIAWLLAMASFAVLVDSISIKNEDDDYLSEEEELERAMPMDEKKIGINDLLKEEMDSNEPSCTNLSVAICKPFTISKIQGVLEQLGMTKDPAVRIANVSKSFMLRLQKNNGTITAPLIEKRSSNDNGICGESTAVKQFELIHPYVGLMYVVNEKKCTGNFCYSSNCFPDNPIGECVVKMGKVRLNLFNGDGELYTKVIETGIACMCKPYS